MSATTLFIVIPFHDAAGTLPRTMASLACLAPASRPRVHLIGVDDGSHDASAARFEEGLAALGLAGTLLRQEQRGTAAARNRALQQLNAGWVLLLDADDELLADPIPWLAAAAGHDTVLCAAEVVRGGRRWRHILPWAADEPFAEAVTARNPLLVGSLLFRRERLQRFFDEELAYLEDWHFWAVNPDLFAAPLRLPGCLLVRIHASAAGKSARLVENGRSRTQAAARIAATLDERLSRRGRNNLRLQELIGQLQAGRRGLGPGLPPWPVAWSLLGKWLIYAFFFPAYRRVFPYR